MADKPLDFDASNLEGLAKILAEQQSLHDLASRAADHRDKVTEVYNRVVRDYELRIRGLEEQAQQLRGRLREEFARLEAVYGEARQALDQARFDLQESEFRREIGEYSVEEFKRRQAATEKVIAGRQGELDRIGQLRGRFLELLPDEDRPAPAALPSVPAAVVPLPVPKPIVPAEAGPAPAVRPAPAPAAAKPSAPPTLATTPGGVGETMVMAPPGSAVFRMPPIPGAADDGSTQILTPPMERGGGPEAAEAFATVAIRTAFLMEEKAGAPPVQHRLGTLTTIGRTPDNQIVVPSREVSRKHAEVVLGQTGYVLRDLGSPNGTFVNNAKVKEHPLRDGDRITLAGVSFVFKSS